MKKFLMCSFALVSLLSSSAIADSASSGFKSGFRVGLGAGYKRFSLTQGLNFVSHNPLISSASASAKKNQNTAAFEGHVAYDFVKDRLYSAVELNYRLSPGENTVSLQHSFLGTPNPQMKYKHRHDFGLSGHLGYIFHPKMVGYLIANVRLGMFEQNYSHPNGPANNFLSNASKKATKFGFGGGLGFKYALPAHWSVGAEATYDVYSSTSISDDIERTAIGVVTGTASRPRVLNVLLKVSKTF